MIIDYDNQCILYQVIYIDMYINIYMLDYRYIHWLIYTTIYVDYYINTDSITIDYSNIYICVCVCLKNNNFEDKKTIY